MTKALQYILITITLTLELASVSAAEKNADKPIRIISATIINILPSSMRELSTLSLLYLCAKLHILFIISCA